MDEYAHQQVRPCVISFLYDPLETPSHGRWNLRCLGVHPGHVHPTSPPAGSGPPQTCPAGSPRFLGLRPMAGLQPWTRAQESHHLLCVPASSGCPIPETIALHGAHPPPLQPLRPALTQNHHPPENPILPSTFRPSCRRGAPEVTSDVGQGRWPGSVSDTWPLRILPPPQQLCGVVIISSILQMRRLRLRRLKMHFL